MSEVGVTVKFFAYIRDAIGEIDEMVFLPEGSKVSDLLENFKKGHPEVLRIVNCSFIALNEEYTEKDTLLKDGDIVAIIPPVSGG